MAITRQDILNAYSGVYNNRQKAQEMERQYRASRTKEDDIADRVNAMSTDEQSALAEALKTGNYRISPSTSAAKEVYDKAISQARFIAQSFGKKPTDADYDDFIENYARQFYDQNIGLGVVSYDQASELNRSAAAYEEDKKKQSYNSALADMFAGAFENQRWKDIVYHIAGQDEKTSTYGQPSYYMSGQNGPQAVGWADTVGATQNKYDNPVQNSTQYPQWFEEYYKNN